VGVTTSYGGGVIYYANPCSGAVADLMSARRLGCITTPKQGNVTFPDDGWDVIADNGCFSDRWDARGWADWLRLLPRSVRFAVCPDVFDPRGEPCHQQTRDRWDQYSGMIRRHGFTPAFVCQVGCDTYADVPDDAEVLFIGGTDRYKMGTEMWGIARRAHIDGRWVHMGRVNSNKRFRTARTMLCDSVDGTYLIKGPDTNLPKLLGWLEDQDRAPMLWETT
jgi:hypothetical protein